MESFHTAIFKLEVAITILAVFNTVFEKVGTSCSKTAEVSQNLTFEATSAIFAQRGRKRRRKIEGFPKTRRFYDREI